MEASLRDEIVMDPIATAMAPWSPTTFRLSMNLHLPAP
jgi:hypothetical protein